MTIEQQQHARLLCIAQMAATILGGLLANSRVSLANDYVENCAGEATILFDAVEASEAKRQADLVNVQGPNQF